MAGRLVEEMAAESEAIRWCRLLTGIRDCALDLVEDSLAVPVGKEV